MRKHKSDKEKRPLKRAEGQSRFKPFQPDTGMPVSRYPLAAAMAVIPGGKSVNNGGVYENVIAQDLASARVASFTGPSAPCRRARPIVTSIDGLVSGRYATSLAYAFVISPVMSVNPMHAARIVERMLSTKHNPMRASAFRGEAFPIASLAVLGCSHNAL